MTNKRLHIGAIGIASASTLILSTACQYKEAQSEKCNVIIIMTDDVGYGDLSCYGMTAIQTPAIDRLAEMGVRFTDAHCTSATSTPSRYGLLTGAYPWRREDTGVADGDDPMVIKPEEFTIADLFQEAGYATAAIGKWHLGLGDEKGSQAWNDSIAPNPADIGFQYSFIMAATGDRVPCVFIENGKVAHYDPSAPIAVQYGRNFEGEPTGRDNPELLFNQKPSHGHDHSIVNGISRIGYMRGGGEALWRDEDIADVITQQAVRFIEAHRAEPFFLYFCPNNIHVPRMPHERYQGKSGMGYRGDAILELDDMVGTLMTTLEREGLLENTLIIFTSDNGPVLDDGYQDGAVELLGDHRPAGPFRSGKYSLYEGGTRVPFIVVVPPTLSHEQPKGTTSDALFTQVDLLSSLADGLGLTLPDTLQLDSKSAWATLQKGDEVREAIIVQGLRQTTALRTTEWKYIPPVERPTRIAWQTGIETGQDTIPQLYHLASDPSEQVNLAQERPEVLQALQALYIETKK